MFPHHSQCLAPQRRLLGKLLESVRAVLLNCLVIRGPRALPEVGQRKKEVFFGVLLK